MKYGTNIYTNTTAEVICINYTPPSMKKRPITAERNDLQVNEGPYSSGDK